VCVCLGFFFFFLLLMGVQGGIVFNSLAISLDQYCQEVWGRMFLQLKSPISDSRKNFTSLATTSDSILPR